MRYIISFLFPLFINGLYAQQLPDSPKLSAYIEQVAYQAEGRPYSEVHLSIDANTINHTQIDSFIQGELEITIAYLQNDTVVHFNKSVVSTPLTKTPTNFFIIKRTGIAKPG